MSEMADLAPQTGLPLPASFDVLLAPKHAIQSCNLLS